MLCALAVALFAAASARAQSVDVTDISRLVGTSTGQIGTSAVLVVPAAGDPNYPAVPSDRTTVTIANASTGSSVSCGYSAQVALNGAGTLTVAAGQTAFWPRGSAPRNPIWCIASAANTPLQVAVGN